MGRTMGRRRCCWVTEAAGARREGCIQRMKVHICSCTAASTRRAHVGNRNKSFRLSFYSGECYFCTSIFDAEDVRFGLYVCRFITGPAVSLRFALRLRSSLSFPSVFNTAVSSPEHRNQKERPAVSIKFVLLLQTSLSFRLCASFCLYLCRFITGTQNQERRTSNIAAIPAYSKSCSRSVRASANLALVSNLILECGKGKRSLPFSTRNLQGEGCKQQKELG